MQFKVPQDVLRPDKIVGFLTMRQLIIVAIGGGIDYSLYIILSKQYLIEIWLIPVVFIGLLTAAFAFFRYHDILFEKFALLFIEYKFKPRKRTWQKMKSDAVLSVLNAPIKIGKEETVKEKGLTEEERRKKLKEITSLVDTHATKMSKFETLNPKP
ncbi:PrgI family protein [Candidatus Peregrinibacteria bacterium]|nr:PrgI family protein [Candidatus Peregrinibacteria bacterium]